MLLLDSSLSLGMTEDEEFAESMLLLDSGSAPGMTEEELMTEDEEFAKAMLLLDSGSAPGMTEEELITEDEEFAKAMLLLDTSLSLGATGEELLSSSHAAKKRKLEIAKAIIHFDFFKATKRPIKTNFGQNIQFSTLCRGVAGRRAPAVGVAKNAIGGCSEGDSSPYIQKKPSAEAKSISKSILQNNGLLRLRLAMTC